VALCLWRLNRVHRYETAITSVGLERVEEQLRPRPPAVKMSFPGLEPDEENLDTLPLEEALGKILKELKDKRDTVQMWEGTHRLLEQLPELSDDALVSGDDAYRVFEDFSVPYRKKGNVLTSRIQTSWPAWGYLRTNSTMPIVGPAGLRA
jgi:hypothetical protein